MFDVSLHRDLKKGRARNSNVKGANEVRTARSALGSDRMSLAH
jgi:DNA-binding transcriptional regulator WhiA